MDIFEKLRLLEEQSKLPIKHFFYYDPLTMDILSIKNFEDNDDSNPFITILHDDLPEKDVSIIDNFKIIKHEGLIKIIKNDRVKNIDPTINNIIEKIRLEEKISRIESKYSFDLAIEQDINEKKFTFKISGYIKDEYKQKNIQDKTLKFFITAENQMDILYDTYEIELKSLINKPVVINYKDEDINSCSIVCYRYFIDYLHLVIE